MNRLDQLMILQAVEELRTNNTQPRNGEQPWRPDFNAIAFIHSGPNDVDPAYLRRLKRAATR